MNNNHENIYIQFSLSSIKILSLYKINLKIEYQNEKKIII